MYVVLGAQFWIAGILPNSSGVFLLLTAPGHNWVPPFVLSGNFEIKKFNFGMITKQRLIKLEGVLDNRDLKEIKLFA